MEVVYEIEDGYVGPSAPQYFEVSEDEILFGCSDESEAMAYIEESMKEHFVQNIRPCMTSRAEIQEWLVDIFGKKTEEENED